MPTFLLPEWGYLRLRSTTSAKGGHMFLLAAYVGRKDYHGELARKTAKYRFECYEYAADAFRNAPLSPQSPFSALSGVRQVRATIGNLWLSHVDLIRRSLFYDVGRSFQTEPIAEHTFSGTLKNTINPPGEYQLLQTVYTDGRLFLNAYRKHFGQPVVGTESLDFDLLEWNFKARKWEKIGPYHVIAVSGSKNVLLLERKDGQMFLVWPKAPSTA